MEAEARAAATKQQVVTQVFRSLTVQQGPGQVLLMMKLGVHPEASSVEVSRAINQIESEIRASFPEIIWSFIEPDIRRE